MKHFRVLFQYTFPYVGSLVPFLISLLFVASASFAGTVVLNGRDISSARNQELKNVNVFISERGEVIITAPHYQVTEEQTFIPLSTAGTRYQAPQHQAPKEIISAMKEKPKDAVDGPVKSGQAPDDTNKVQQPASGTQPNAAQATPGNAQEKPGTR